MERLVGRAELLAAVQRRVAAGGGVLLTGPDGIGKTAVLEAVAATAAGRGEQVLRISASESERWLPYAGLADLFSQVPPAVVAQLPAPQRVAVESVLDGAGAPGGVPDGGDLASRLALRAVLLACAALRPVLLVVDDAHWLDPVSVEVIAFAVRRIAHGVRAVVAQRWPERAAPRAAAEPEDAAHAPGENEGGAARARTAARLSPPPVLELVVPPLAAHDMAELLEVYGLPYRAANRLHAESGGNPYLALALGGAFVHRPAVGWRPVPMPEPVRALLSERIAGLPAAAAQTLLVAALATRPTVAQLRLAGRADAERHVRLATAAGLVEVDGAAIRFTPAAVATVLADHADARQRSAIHATLARVAIDEVERARHRAMSSPHPDAEVARSLVTAAEGALRRGARGLVADLYLLAADRTPADLGTERLDWLVAAAEAATAAGQTGAATQAVEAILAADAPPEHRVRARMAQLDLAGQALGAMDEVFAAAFADAGTEPALLAPLHLRLAWQAMMRGQPDAAVGQADAALALAGRLGDSAVEGPALTVRAQVERLAGRPAYAATLARALALPQVPGTGRLHVTARYLAVRLSIADDRLDASRTELLTMLAQLERGAGSEEMVEVLRSLAEVSARAGRCAEALDFAGRALRASLQTELSPGPSWYTAAVAELAGGTVAGALGYAEHGVRASEQEHDSVYLSRTLHAAGQARLRLGDARGAADDLRRLRELERVRGVADPTQLRWHADLAAALVPLGEQAEAAETIAAARAAAHPFGADGVLAQLDRADAILHIERGAPDLAVALCTRAAHTFERLNQPVERGHALLVLAQAERRRRRYAAARATVDRAIAVFAGVAARPWAEQAERLRHRIDGGGAEAPRAGAELTSMESRVAQLVREGASNREIAARLFISVKTVEATLTRVYRKLGVRSRTQLSVRLDQG